MEYFTTQIYGRISLAELGIGMVSVPSLPKLATELSLLPDYQPLVLIDIISRTRTQALIEVLIKELQKKHHGGSCQWWI